MNSSFLYSVRNTLLVLLLILAGNQLLGQETEKVVYNNSHFWWSINSTLRLTNKWGFMADVHIRRQNFLADPSFYFGRLGAVYWIEDNLSVAFGYANLQLAVQGNDGYNFAGENRAYQQMQWNASVGHSSFFHRIRTEQRWREQLDMDGMVQQVDFSVRVRYLLSIKVPIWRKNNYMPAPVVANEVLIQFGDELVYNTFDQNRTFFGISQRITPNLSFDMGYMVVFQQRASGFEYDRNHTFRLFFYYTPDLRKSDKDKKEFPPIIIPGEE